ncbi:uncharacterized protein LOC115573630 isoform X2 [Sparus aurata]|uniref:uncharacterized protein LOC115573630 isoform X2 n=1 Tax=Sparus aurata TaxID=8175 RepID=UPI0011C13FFD|nr:uncharacterized protein LOC115573630 isoform X2 [Sparus aurata]
MHWSDIGYHPLRDMDTATVSGKRFFVKEAGRTHGTHLDYVRSLNSIGHAEVFSPEESDYIVVFCPIASRVGTDVGEALENIPGGKPTILVVMHHTFNPDHVVADSSRQVTNPNVRLTVDCLFYEGKLLKCNRNDIAWYDIQKALGVPVSQVSKRNCCYCDCNWFMKNPWVVVGLTVGAALLIAMIVIVYEVTKK